MHQAAVLSIFLIVFLEFVGFGILLPVLPVLVPARGGSATSLGLIIGAFSLTQFLVSPLWGRISDHWGRRPVILLNLLGTALAFSLLGVSGSVEWILISRVIAGISGATLSLAYTYILDVTTLNASFLKNSMFRTSPVSKDNIERAKGFAFLGMAVTLGLVFGPAIGGPFSRYGVHIPILIAAGIAASNLLFAFLTLDEVKLTSDARSSNRYKRFDLSLARQTLEDVRTRLSAGFLFVVTFAVSQIETVCVLFLTRRFRIPLESIGVLLAIMGAMGVASQTLLAPRLASRIGEIRLTSFGSILAASALLMATLSFDPMLCAIALIATSATQGLVFPSLSRLAFSALPKSQAMIGIGVYRSFGSFARIIGPPLAGWLFDSFGWRSPLLGAVLLLTFTALIALLWAIVPSKVLRVLEAQNNPYQEG